MPVTIKNILDRFAEEDLVNPQFAKTVKWRTQRCLCPLQVFFCPKDISLYFESAKSIAYVIERARQAGMVNGDIERIMTWADTGRWPTSQSLE